MRTSWVHWSEDSFSFCHGDDQCTSFEIIPARQVPAKAYYRVFVVQSPSSSCEDIFLFARSPLLSAQTRSPRLPWSHLWLPVLYPRLPRPHLCPFSTPYLSVPPFFRICPSCTKTLAVASFLIVLCPSIFCYVFTPSRL